MVGQNFELLNFILKKLDEIDPVLLDQLNYYFEKEVREDDDDMDFDEEEEDDQGDQDHPNKDESRSKVHY